MFQRRSLRFKGLLISVAAFVLCVAGFLVLVIFAGRPRADIDLGFDCHFLVRGCNDSTSAAVVGEVYSAGGAGYLYGESVILACYYTKADARRVCSLMEQAGEEVSVLSLSSEPFTLRGDDALLAEKVKGNAETVQSVARILYDTANGLERGTLGQTAAKANLKGAADALEGLVASNSEGLFARWNRTLGSIARRAREKARGILFAKDVRYLQVSLCCTLLDMKTCF